MSAKEKTVAFISEIDPNELAVRIIEKMMDLRRPPNMTMQQVIAATDEETWKGGLRAALAAMEYVTEQINAGVRPS